MPIINSVIKGKQPQIESLNVTPTTSAQTINAPTGKDGYSPVNVSAVTSSIDANIVAGNIKDGVTILGVTGDYQGQVPSGTKTITSNGVTDVSGYANADVQVPTTAPAYYIEKTKDANNKLVNGGSTVIDLTGVTDVGHFALHYAYYGDTNIIGNIDLSSLTTISGQNALADTFENCTGITSVDLSGLINISSNGCFRSFGFCTGITSVDLSSLATVSGSSGCAQMFSVCTGITSIDLSSLTTISGMTGCAQMFYGCSGITSVDLSSLATVSGQQGCSQMFQGCTGLTSVVLSSLATVSGQNGCRYMFQSCTSLTTLSFPALTSTSFGSFTNQFNGMLQGVTGCTVHFPSNLQSVIGSWSDVTAGFGGTNTTVLYDLPATE